MSPSDQKKEIVIIGGGIIGCTSAYFLTHHPAYNPSTHKVTLLEATKIAGGASGKAGGLLALWAYPSSIVPLSYRLHKELADKHGGVERWGYRAVHCGQVECKGRQLRSKQDNDGVEGKDGEMDGENETQVGGKNVSLQKRDGKALGKLRAAGVPAELDWVDHEGLRMYDEMGDPSTTAQVHPYQFTTSMADLAAEKGADIRVGAAVKRIEYSEEGKSVTGVVYEDKNDGGKEVRLSATDVLVSAGPWTQEVYPDAPISALRAHSVTIRPSREVSAYALFTEIHLPPGFGNEKVSRARSKYLGGRGETVTPEIYARPKNEVYACGEGDHEVPLPKSSDLVQVDEKRCQDIVDQVGSISDELRDGEVTARQACYLPNVNASGSGGPLIGETGVKGLLMAAGHTCWGIQNGPGTGKLISEFIFDGKAKSAKIQALDPRIVL
ncbi:fad NAD binding oxidoreductase [Delphinella strobiligena]|nr:fad NAD binding oxidoreductase [Delphinella strobiligena]